MYRSLSSIEILSTIGPSSSISLFLILIYGAWAYDTTAQYPASTRIVPKTDKKRKQKNVKVVTNTELSPAPSIIIVQENPTVELEQQVSVPENVHLPNESKIESTKGPLQQPDRISSLSIHPTQQQGSEKLGSKLPISANQNVNPPKVPISINGDRHLFRSLPRPKIEQYNDNEKTEEIRHLQSLQTVKLGFVPGHQSVCHLLLCVDATPKGIGGYLVDLRTGICEFYSFGINRLPWNLKDRSPEGFSAEFEMRNLHFALTLWESRIKSCGSLQIHTDNPARATCEYRAEVDAFLEHIRICDGVKVDYNITNLYKPWKHDDFVRFIQPADDLSRNKVATALLHLRKIYGIFKFTGAFKNNTCMETYYNFLNTVDRGLEHWQKKECPGCGYRITNTDSLKKCGKSS